MQSEVTMIGAGFVSNMLMQRLVERGYADVVMYDIILNMPQRTRNGSAEIVKQRM